MGKYDDIIFSDELYDDCCDIIKDGVKVALFFLLMLFGAYLALPLMHAVISMFQSQWS